MKWYNKLYYVILNMKCTNNTIGSDYLLSFRRVYCAFKINFQILSLELCLVLLVTYYALNYAEIISRGLIRVGP